LDVLLNLYYVQSLVFNQREVKEREIWADQLRGGKARDKGSTVKLRTKNAFGGGDSIHSAFVSFVERLS